MPLGPKYRLRGHEVRRLVLISIVMLLGGAQLIRLGWRQAALYALGRTTTGFITKTYQPPPGRFRASDIEITYTFRDDSGRFHSGKDVLPPAYPPQSNSIAIRYRHSH